MSNRIDGRHREILGNFITERDGHYCLACFAEGAGKRQKGLELDHANNNPTDWSPSNIHWLCKTHNLRFRQLSVERHVSLLADYSAVNVCVRAKFGRDPRRIAVTEEVDVKAGSTEIILNSFYEPGWIKYINQCLIERGTMTKDDAINGGAAEVRCSNSTTGRYYKVHTSSRGHYEEFTDSDGHRCIRFRDIGKQKYPSTIPKKVSIP